jgi:uncharacterized membrane protein HdeD (DUF308 family)
MMTRSRRLPSWRLPIVRGVAALCLAAAVSAASRPSARWLAVAMAAYCILDGLVAIAAAHRRSVVGLAPWCLLVRGGGSTAAGVALVLLSRGAVQPIHALIIGWAGFAGLFDIIGGWCARGPVDGATFLALNGLVTAFLGVILATLPPAALPDVADLIAMYATIAGTLLLLLGVRLALHTAPAGVGIERPV